MPGHRAAASCDEGRPRHRAALRRRTGQFQAHSEPARLRDRAASAHALRLGAGGRPQGPCHRQDRRHLLDARDRRCQEGGRRCPFRTSDGFRGQRRARFLDIFELR